MDDRTLRHVVLEELEWTPRIDASDVVVAVHDGVVALSGRVRTLAEKKLANCAVWHLRGVVGVRDDIVVQPLAMHRPPDEELAQRAEQILAWDALVPGGAIGVRAEFGVITLTGTLDEPHLRSEAEQRVHQLAGVVNVDNRIDIRPRAQSAAHLHEKVVRALARHSELDSSAITVDVRDNQVTLSGTVPSFVQRRIAENAAWAAPGVYDVVDRLHVLRAGHAPMTRI